MKTILFKLGKLVFLVVIVLLTIFGVDNYYAQGVYSRLQGLHHQPGWFGGLFFGPYTEIRNDGDSAICFHTEDGSYYALNPGEVVQLKTPAIPGEPYWLYRTVFGVSIRAMSMTFPDEAGTQGVADAGR